MCKDPRLGMGKRTKKIFDDKNAWHNQLRQNVTDRVDEDIFEPLYSKKRGAPNAPIRRLVAMLVLKEAQGMSDEQLYEQARFNMVARSALGIVNSDEEVPTESTYYLFRKRIAEHEERTGENLLEKAFEGITRGQCKEYNVSGKWIRMDSKLLGSNIAWYSRYEIIHETIRKYCKANGIKEVEVEDKAQLAAVLNKTANSVTYRNTKEEVEQRLEKLGKLVYRLVTAEGAEGTKEYGLLKRVFEAPFSAQ